MSMLRSVAKNIKEKKPTAMYGTQNSSMNFIFYGVQGKSSLCLSQIEGDDSPILCISVAGCSSHLQDEYPNAVIRTAKNLEELEAIISDLESNFTLFQEVAKWTSTPDLALKYKDVFLKKYYKGKEEEGKEDYDYILSLIAENKFIFSRVVLEEVDLISNWIQQEVESRFELEVIGQDKKNLASDWSELQKSTQDFYSRWLRLPCITILATAERLPYEKQNLKLIVPNICMGSAQRILIGSIGNEHYITNINGKYEVYIKATSEAQVRCKFIPIMADLDKIPDKIDITNNPSAFWQFVEDCRNKKVPMLETLKK